MPKDFRGVFCTILLMAFMLHTPGNSSRLLYAAPSSASPVSAELPDIQAAFIFNLMKFTTWPASASLDGENIKVGLIGHDNITEILEQKLSGRQVQNKPVLVEHIHSMQSLYDVEALNEFQLIYISKDVATQSQLEQLSASSALLVSNYESFVQDGGCVGVVYSQRKNKVDLHINLKRLNQKNITLSSKLLKIAAVVE